MAARVLTYEEYTRLIVKAFGPDEVSPNTVTQVKQVHRLLCDGHKVEELTPIEQAYATVFDGLTCVQIPNDYGWEPGVEEAEVTEAEPEAKPKKQKRSE